MQFHFENIKKYSFEKTSDLKTPTFLLLYFLALLYCTTEKLKPLFYLVKGKEKGRSSN